MIQHYKYATFTFSLSRLNVIISKPQVEVE
jgi:hypothetical protein